MPTVSATADGTHNTLYNLLYRLVTLANCCTLKHRLSAGQPCASTWQGAFNRERAYTEGLPEGMKRKCNSFSPTYFSPPKTLIWHSATQCWHFLIPAPAV